MGAICDIPDCWRGDSQLATIGDMNKIQEQFLLRVTQEIINIADIVKQLLTPAKSSGTYVTKIFDYKCDMPTETTPQQSPMNAMFIIDGAFLRRPAFRHF